MSPIGRVVILVLMYVNTFRTDVIVFISNIITSLTDNIHHHQRKSVDTDDSTQRDQRKKVQISNKFSSNAYWTYVFLDEYWYKEQIDCTNICTLGIIYIELHRYRYLAQNFPMNNLYKLKPICISRIQ